MSYEAQLEPAWQFRVATERKLVRAIQHRGPEVAVGSGIVESEMPISWSDAMRDGPSPLLPPVFSNRDKAYETWKFNSRTPRSGFCAFLCEFRLQSRYTPSVRSVLRNGRGGALGLMPGKAHV